MSAPKLKQSPRVLSDQEQAAKIRAGLREMRKRGMLTYAEAEVYEAMAALAHELLQPRRTGGAR